MAPSPQQWDAYDPLTDNLYCRVPCSDDDVISTQTHTTNETDEVAVRRYEDVARRYLTGYAPLLITSTLRGPFDRASGFVNPWAGPIKPSQTTQRSTFHPLLKTQSPGPCEPALSPRVEATQATESSYLPSPESLNPDTHPFLERDDIVRVERWRNRVQPSAPIRDEFWASTSQSQSQSAKRPRADSSWLRRRADKRRRTLEPEAKLSSPVSIGDGGPRQGASSPLSSLTSLNGGLTPAQPSSQPRTETRVRPDESTVAGASHDPTFSSSQRLSRRASQGSRLPHGSEASRRGVSRHVSSRITHRGSSQSERRPPQSLKSAVSEKSRRHSTSVRRSSPAVEPQNIHISSDDSTSISSTDESNHEEALEGEQNLVKVDNGPAVHAESGQDKEGQDIVQQSKPENDGVLRVTDPNVTPKKAGAGGNALEAALLSASKLDHHGVWGKHIDRDLKWQSRFSRGREFQDIVPKPPVARSPGPSAPDAGNSPDRLSRDETAMEHHHDEGEPTPPVSALAVADLSTCSSVSASSLADYASTTLVEGGENAGMEDVQTPHEGPTPTKPAVLDPYTVYTSSPCKTDNTASQGEMQPQEVEPRSTPQPDRHTRDTLPDTLPDSNVAPSGTQRSRVAVEEQSPWMKASVRVLVNGEQKPWMESSIRHSGNDGSKEQSPWMKNSVNNLANGSNQQSPLTIEIPDQPTQSSIVSPEAQSPWVNRLATQPGVVNDTYSTPCSSPQLPPPSEPTQEEPRATEAAERSNILSDVSNTDFSIRSFSSFMMSPKSKSRPFARLSDSYLPHTPSLLAAATENPWETASKPKKRVSWAPLPREASSPAPMSSFNRASPPPAEPIPDDVEEVSGVFGSHFASVKRRTDPVRQRLLPTPSQLSQRSPETDAMAMAFVTAESSTGSSPMNTWEKCEEVRDEVGDVATGEEGGYGDGEGTAEGPVDDVDDVLANLNEFLTTWDVETDLQRARNESRVSHEESTTRFRGIVDMEVGGW